MAGLLNGSAVFCENYDYEEVLILYISFSYVILNKILIWKGNLWREVWIKEKKYFCHV